jgi:hypothetical protein
MRDQLLRKFYKQKKFKFFMSLIIDAMGYFSYAIPGFGEVTDAFWAPISGIAIYLLYPNRKRFALMGMVEESLPMMDFIPTALIAWHSVYQKDPEKALTDFLYKEVKEKHIVDEMLKDIDYPIID